MRVYHEHTDKETGQQIRLDVELMQEDVEPWGLRWSLFDTLAVCKRSGDNEPWIETHGEEAEKLEEMALESADLDKLANEQIDSLSDRG